MLYDWEEGLPVRRLEITNMKKIYWNDKGSLFAISSGEECYFLRFKKEVKFFIYFCFEIISFSKDL